MSDLYAAKATFFYDGNRVVQKGQVARQGSEILRAHPEMFEPLAVDFDVTRPAPRHPAKPKE